MKIFDIFVYFAETRSRDDFIVNQLLELLISFIQV